MAELWVSENLHAFRFNCFSKGCPCALVSWKTQPLVENHKSIVCWTWHTIGYCLSWSGVLSLLLSHKEDKHSIKAKMSEKVTEWCVSPQRYGRMYRVGGTHCTAGELSERLYLHSESWSHLSEVKVSAGVSRMEIPTCLCLQCLARTSGFTVRWQQHLDPSTLHVLCGGSGWGTGCAFGGWIRDQKGFLRISHPCSPTLQKSLWPFLQYRNTDSVFALSQSPLTEAFWGTHMASVCL